VHDRPLAARNHDVQASVPHPRKRTAFAAGAYEVVTDEEKIAGLSFAAWGRVATSITVP
jgi:hypothetical protein